MASIIANRVKVYLCPLDHSWVRLQQLYVAGPRETSAEAATRRLFFRNALQGAIASAEYVRGQANAQLTSLIAHVTKTTDFTGLESVFLTLMNSVNAAGNSATFSAAGQCWTKFSKNFSVGGAADQLVFYDITSRNFAFFSNAAFNSLRTGGANSSLLKPGAQFGASVAALGSFHVQNPFGSTKIGTAMANAPSPADTWEAGFHAAGAIMVAGGVAAELIPGGQAIGAFLIVAGVSIEAGVEAAKFVADLNASDSSVVNSGNVEVDSNTLVEDSSGDIGTVESGGPGPDPDPNPDPNPDPTPDPDPDPDPNPDPNPDPDPEPEPEQQKGRRRAAKPKFAPGHGPLLPKRS